MLIYPLDHSTFSLVFALPLPSSRDFEQVLSTLFVAVNSHVLTRLGMMKTTLLVITGQMLTGILLDRLAGLERPALTQLLGAALLLAGLWLARRPRTGARA
ncbi:hypothetical protein DBB33_11130 [Chromobacterium haemolyticum]|nr:hypothetical protein DBB33_11130 [Chromobacterium haemolyticum]